MGPLPDFGGALLLLVVFAGVGLAAMFGGLVWLIWWLVSNVTVVIA